MDIGFVNLLAVSLIAFGAPLALGMVPALRVPAVVAGIALGIALGIAVGPSGLGWVQIDEPVEIVALLGLAFLLFLAGLELDLRRLRLRLASSSERRSFTASGSGCRARRSSPACRHLGDGYRR